MADHMSDDEIVALARIASASNNYSGGRWISAEFSRDDLIGFARAVLSSATSSVAVQEEGDAKRLAFLCDPSEGRYVEECDGLWRVYRDLGVEKHDWRAMTMKYYPSANEAIDAAMPCMPTDPKGDQP